VGNEAATEREIELPRACWHCGGSALCSCIGCAENPAWAGSGECLVCFGTGFAFPPHAVNWQPTEAEKAEWKRKHSLQVKWN